MTVTLEKKVYLTKDEIAFAQVLQKAIEDNPGHTLQYYAKLTGNNNAGLLSRVLQHYLIPNKAVRSNTSSNPGSMGNKIFYPVNKSIAVAPKPVKVNTQTEPKSTLAISLEAALKANKIVIKDEPEDKPELENVLEEESSVDVPRLDLDFREQTLLYFMYQFDRLGKLVFIAPHLEFLKRYDLIKSEGTLYRVRIDLEQKGLIISRPYEGKKAHISLLDVHNSLIDQVKVLLRRYEESYPSSAKQIKAYATSTNRNTVSTGTPNTKLDIEELVITSSDLDKVSTVPDEVEVLDNSSIAIDQKQDFFKLFDSWTKQYEEQKSVLLNRIDELEKLIPHVEGMRLQLNRLDSLIKDTAKVVDSDPENTANIQDAWAKQEQSDNSSNGTQPQPIKDVKNLIDLTNMSAGTISSYLPTPKLIRAKSLIYKELDSFVHVPDQLTTTNYLKEPYKLYVKVSFEYNLFDQTFNYFQFACFSTLAESVDNSTIGDKSIYEIHLSKFAFDVIYTELGAEIKKDAWYYVYNSHMYVENAMEIEV